MDFLKTINEIRRGPPEDIPEPPRFSNANMPDQPELWSYWRIFHTGVTKIDKGNKEWADKGVVPESDDQPDWRGVVRKNIIPMEPVEEYKFGAPVDRRYFWFDTPDYADPLKKLAYATRVCLRYSVIYACFIGVVTNRPATWKNVGYLWTKHAFPMFASSFSAATTVIVTSNLRGNKDDVYNYIIGGALGGLIMASTRGNHLDYLRWVPPFTVMSLLFKYVAETNGQLWPNPNERRLKKYSVTGYQGTGFSSGDWRFGFRTGPNDDPGRDVRKFPY